MTDQRNDGALIAPVEYERADALKGLIAGMRAADAEKRSHADNLFALLRGSTYADEKVCASVFRGQLEVEEAIKCLSTSERITVALACGRIDLLRGDFRDFRLAWQRLNKRQRSVVDTFARADWDRY
jgi:hypothetical protein